MSDLSTVFTFPDREITLAVDQKKYHKLCQFLCRYPAIYNYSKFGKETDVDNAHIGTFNRILNTVYTGLQDEFRIRHVDAESAEEEWSAFCSDWQQASTTAMQEVILYTYICRLYYDDEPYEAMI